MDPFISKPGAGSYLQYKRSQRKVSDWLVENTQGLIVHSFSSAACLSSKTLIELAKTVAAERKAVPALVLELLTEVIDARTTFAVWYSSPGSTPDVTNDSHQKFISVLQEVYGFLRPCRQTESSPVAPSKGPKKRGRRAREVLCFEALSVEELADSPPGAESMPITRHIKACGGSKVDDGAAPTHSIESLFDLWCFLRDLQDIRRMVVQTWQGYARGEISILVASATLEVGFALMRRANEAFACRNPEIEDWADVAMALVPDDPENIEDGSSEQHSSLRGREELVGVSGALSLFALRKAFLSRVRQRRLPNSHIRSLGQGHVDFTSYVGGLAHELCILIGLDSPPNAAEYTFQRSEFIDGLMDYYKSGSFCPWLAIAYQTYDEIFGIVGLQPHCVVGALSRHVESSSHNFKCHSEHKAVIKSRELLWDDSLAVERWKQCQGRVFISSSELHQRQPERHEMPQSGDLVEVKSIWGLPCAAGYMLWQSKVYYHELGLRTADDFGMILALAHLYTACRRYGLLRTVWHDMEFVMAQQKAIKPLVLKANDDDPFTYVKHFLVALGITASAFSAGKTPALPPESRAHTVLHSSIGPQKTSQYIRLMDEYTSEPGASRSRHDEPVEAVLTTMFNNTACGRKGNTAGENSPTQTQLLDTFKTSLIKDEPHINFDYVGFWSTCRDMYLELMSSVRAKTRTILKLALPYQMIHHVLLEAANTRATRGGTFVGTSIAGIAARMRVAIAKDSNKYSREAYRASSGHIPKEDRPKFGDGGDSKEMVGEPVERIGDAESLSVADQTA